MRKLLVTKSILHAKFCLQINARVCLSNSRWILFCNNNVVVVVGCDATIHYFSGFVKVMKHMPYQSFLWIERSIPKVQILLRCLTKKNAWKMAIRCKYLTCLIQNDGSNHCPLLHQKTLLQLQSPMQYHIILCFFVKMYSYYLLTHSSEIRGLCLMKCPSEILENLPYIYHNKSHVVFFVFHFMQLYLFY